MHRKTLSMLASVLALIFFLTPRAPITHAATPLIVNTNADNATGGDGSCTLREAITNINAQNESSGGDCLTGNGNDTILFSINAPIVLGSPLPDLNHDMFMDGGKQGVTVSGNNSVRHFVINNPFTVGLRRMTLTQGRAPNGANQGMTLCTAGAPGGAIFNGGTLTLHEVRITASRAGTGGNSLNQAGCRGGDGGAIFNATTGTLNAYRSTFDNNDAGYGGDSGNGNGGPGADGGAIYNSGGGFVWLQNVTLTRNDRGYGGAGTTGGLHGDGPEVFHNGGAMTLVFTTVWNNSLIGTLVSANGKTIVLRNSLLANSGQNCSLSLPGTFTDAGYNIESGATCGFSAAGSLSNTASGLLTTLQANGGYVPTLALNPTSTAIDRLNDGVNVCGSGGGITDDARGVARPKNGKCDIGAYEYIGMPGTNFVVNHAFGFYDGYCDTLGTGLGSQDCTFMEAIDAANATPGLNTITFDIPDTDPDCNTPDVCFIALLAPPAPLNDDVTIDGSAQHITLSGEYNNRILEVNANVTATVNALSIRNGRCYDCSGGGIWNKGNLTITSSTFRDNAALGSDNISDDGGGIFNQGALNITNSTFTENNADDGGAILNSGGSLTMTNVTVANNSADVVGGIFSNGSVTINNTLVSNNSNGNCSNPFNNTGANNLSSDGTCGGTFTQKTVGEINLQGLADNGGNTYTMALLYPSAAIDTGNNTVCANAPINNLDQRGAARPQDGNRDSSAVCDIGAYEAPIPPPTQSGPNFIVNHAADTDDGLCDVLGQGFFNKDCTLREAINSANARSGADTIKFNIPASDAPACSTANHCTITLDSTLPALNDTTTIDGSANNGDITISGNDAVRVFYINSGKTVTLDTLTITNAWCDAACNSGAGIRNHGALTVKNSAILYNRSQFSGGGIYSELGSLDISNSTIANNQAGGAGGGVISYQGGATLTNSTIVGNSAGTLGSGVYSFLGTLTMNNTLIAGNTGANRDCDGTASGSNNLIQDNSNACGLSNGVNGNIIGSNPNLAALGENGGPTQTIAPQYPSDAIDRGDNTICQNAPINNKDQRGTTRPIDGNGDSNVVCDIGAYEAPAFTGTQSGPNFVVNSAVDTDDGFCDVLGQGAGNKDCTLREAINAANALSGADTITFDIPDDVGALCSADNICTITLSALGSLPAINGNLTINGSANSAVITVSGADTYQVLLVNTGIVFNLNQLTIAHGRTIADGGGLDNQGGTVTITNSTFAYNSATSGSGRGGAIYNTGTLTIRRSTFHHNTSPYYGAGAIHSDAGTVNISNSTFNLNDGQGGGTIVNNATLNVWNSTVSGNNFGITSSSAATLKNTIVADNADGDCSGTITADKHNLDTDDSCGSATQTTFGAIDLQAVADNGGATHTMALGNLSVAIDAGDDIVCAALPVNALDQRGEARDDLQCDVGAFEFVNSDGHTIIKTFGADNATLTFGPTLAHMQLITGSPLTLNVNRELPGTRPGTPPANSLPITWGATTQTVTFDLLATLCYDPTGLTPTYENSLHVWHYNGSTWDDLGGTLDTSTHAPYHCVTATTALTSLSPLILAPNAPTATNVTGVKGLVNKNGKIVLRWKTTSETQIAGFNIYRRGKQGEWKQINAKFRQAKHAGAALGDTYRYIDRKANATRTQRYKIEIVYLDGHSEWTKVIRVRVP